MNEEESLAKRIETDSSMAASLANYQKSATKRTIRHILTQEYDCDYANLTVSRDKCEVTIKWLMEARGVDVNRVKITGAMREMSLVPDPSYDIDRVIHIDRGNNVVQLQLEEGCSYYFEFLFSPDPDPLKATGAKAKTEFDVIWFHVAVPLADSHKEIVRQALSMEQHPKKKVRHALKKVLELQDTFAEMDKLAVTRIKAKGLSQEDEEERIQDFREQASHMRGELGM